MPRSLALALSLSLAACGHAYDSYYRETNRALQPVPRPAEAVAVIRSADHLDASWTELGRYVGHAPTLKEAMESAQRTCGRAGADYFILLATPLGTRGTWQVRGRCAARTPSAEPGAWSPGPLPQ